MTLFKRSSLSIKSMNAPLIIGVVMLSVAAITLGIALPVLDMLQPCPRVYVPDTCYYEKELPISLFAVALTIGGLGTLALYRFRELGIEKKKTDV